MLSPEHYQPDATILMLSSQCNRPDATIPMQPIKQYRHNATIRMPLNKLLTLGMKMVQPCTTDVLFSSYSQLLKSYWEMSEHDMIKFQSVQDLPRDRN